MRRFKMMLFAAALVAAFVAGGTARAGDGELVLEETHSLSRGQSLSVDSGRGGVRITGESRSDVHIQVWADGMDVEDARDLLDLDVRETSDGLLVVVDIEDGRGFLGLGRRSRGNIWVEISLPRRTDVNIENGSGGVRVQEIEGRVDVDNGSGGVKLADIDGDITIDNGSGGVSVKGVDGSVDIDNGSGGIRASEVRGDVTIDNSSGGVSLDTIDGRLEVDNGSGGVKAEMSGRNHGIHVETSSGGVTLEIPDDWGADLDLRSRSSDISVRGFRNLDLDDVDRFRGAIGGGGETISVDSGSGQVIIRGS